MNPNESDLQFKPRRRISSGTLFAIVFAVVILLLCAAFVFIYNDNKAMSKKIDDQQQIIDDYVQAPELTPHFITNKLESASELTTAKLKYSGLVQYEEGTNFLNKKSFWLYFEAEVRASFDLSELQIRVTDTHVDITLPEIGEADINVDNDSLKMLDFKAGIFTDEKMEDLQNAVAAAEEQVRTQGAIEELKSEAKQEAILLISALLDGQIGDRTLNIS